MSRFNKGQLLAALALAAALASTPALAAKVYSWVDAQGKTHFGDKPPKDAQARQVKVSDTTSSDADDELKRLEERRAAAAAERAREKGDEKAPDVGSADDRERMQKLCEQHRKNLDALKSGKRVQTKDEKGNPRYLTDQEMQERTAFTQGEVDRCGQFQRISPAAAKP